MGADLPYLYWGSTTVFLGQIDWQTWAAIIGTVVPLLGVPLAVMTLYLKSIRDYQADRCEGIEVRVTHLDSGFNGVSQRIGEFERDFATKEEWLRESMHARKQLEKLTELVTRIQVGVENGAGLASHFAQATEAMVRLTEKLVERRN